jgi:hypothetical protein
LPSGFALRTLNQSLLTDLGLHSINNDHPGSGFSTDQIAGTESIDNFPVFLNSGILRYSLLFNVISNTEIKTSVATKHRDGKMRMRQCNLFQKSCTAYIGERWECLYKRPPIQNNMAQQQWFLELLMEPASNGTVDTSSPTWFYLKLSSDFSYKAK